MRGGRHPIVHPLGHGCREEGCGCGGCGDRGREAPACRPRLCPGPSAGRRPLPSRNAPTMTGWPPRRPSPARRAALLVALQSIIPVVFNSIRLGRRLQLRCV